MRQTDILWFPSPCLSSLCLSLPTLPPLGVSFFVENSFQPPKPVFLIAVSMNCLPVTTFVFLSWCFPNKHPTPLVYLTSHPASWSAPGHVCQVPGILSSLLTVFLETCLPTYAPVGESNSSHGGSLQVRVHPSYHVPRHLRAGDLCLRTFSMGRNSRRYQRIWKI